ncbi:MAG: 4Fe-4S binding protein [bacterium]
MKDIRERVGPLKTAVLICGDVDLDLEEILRWLPEAFQDISAHIVPDLCRRPEEIGKLVGAGGASRLVLGLCSVEFAVAEVQTQARKSGLDALGIEVIDLRAYAASVHPRLQATERAKILLAASIARARAFPGSRPENAKPHFSASARVSRRSLFKLPLLEYWAVPSIQESQCAANLGCNVCVRVCPRGALEWSYGGVRCNKMKCEPCGLCITACPRGALIDPTITTSQLEAQVSTLLDPAIGTLIGIRGVFFTCQRAAAPEGPYDAGWLPIRVPCVGMAPPSWLLAPLILGASAVGVLPCSGGCPLGQDEAIEGRVGYCRELLRLMGAPPDLVRLSPTLDQLPQGDGRRVDVEAPFGHRNSARVFIALARRCFAPSNLSLEHPHSPLGVVEVRGDVCTGCGTCAVVCPTGALGFEHGEDVPLTFDATLCTACGQCLTKCPEAGRGAIRLFRRTDLECLGQGRKPIYREGTVRCAACGAPIAPNKMIKRIEELLGSEYTTATSILARYCPDCRSVLGFSWLGRENPLRR